MHRCAELIDRWGRAFPDAFYWLTSASDYGLREGWSLPTLFGRRIKIPVESTQWGGIDEAAMRRKGANYPILGSDGEVIKRALIICDKAKLPLAIEVHDSIVLDGDCEFPIAQLENITPFRVPFVVSKSSRWE